MINDSLFINKTFSRAELLGLLEAILFVNGKPVSKDDLKAFFGADDDYIDSMIEELNNQYAKRHAGFKIIPVSKGFQIVTNPEYKDLLMELFGKKSEVRLPKSALETLAIIAYKQPISKEEIDKIRGVSSTRSINTLLEYKLVEFNRGENEDTVVYGTTDRFLEIFRITSITDLPPIKSLEFDSENTAGNIEEEQYNGEDMELEFE